MVPIIKSFQQASKAIQFLVVVIALAMYAFTSYLLETNYANSKFPVPYFVQQTSFDAVQMKTWYAHMIAQQTFDIYLQTQFIDFAFIVAVVVAGFTLWTFVANLFAKDSLGHRIGLKMAFALPLAGLFDALENFVSLVMIAHPIDFDDYWVIPYSTFAVIKFTCWLIGLLWLLMIVAYLPFYKVFHSKQATVG